MSQATEKGRAAYNVCSRWSQDWGGTKRSVEPTAREIIRGLAYQGWYGHSRQPSNVTGVKFWAGAGYFAYNRPAKVNVYSDADGNYAGMGMVSEAGYAVMASLDRAEALVIRYQRFCQHMREARHNWTLVRDVHYADNSTEREERSMLTGQLRSRMTTAPHGDACF